MAAITESQEDQSFYLSPGNYGEYGSERTPQRRPSPSPSLSPTPAIRAVPELQRSVSADSSVYTEFSGRSSSGTRERESLGSATTSNSRQSSGSYTSRQSTGGLEKPKRRGYVRPQGTYFAASAQSRESVMSLGSIAHLQYYFARTGLLDGKGGRLKMKTGPLKDLDLSSLNEDFLGSSGRDSYMSTAGSPEFFPSRPGVLSEASIQEEPESYRDEYEYASDDEDPAMLPPTVSTYNARSKHIPPPPTLEELKTELHSTLREASSALSTAKNQHISSQMPTSPSRRHSDPPTSAQSPINDSENRGWYELQGMHILDVVTLAIRAAKIYYTAHDQPARLSSIKSERKIRSELLGVMDVLKRMATRNFAGGMKDEEREVMERWIEGIWDMLSKETQLEEAEKAERSSWQWLDDNLWPTSDATTPCIDRELSFLRSMAPVPSILPPYTPSAFTLTDSIPPQISVSPFLKSFQDGRTLITLHNVCVKRSKRPFGAVPKWHDDTGKPYRMAENLRFWLKAAELRWEIVLKDVDVMAVVNGTEEQAWRDFESAIWRWCEVVRRELAGELVGPGA